MNAKKWAKRVFGILLVVVGCLFLLPLYGVIQSGRIANLWIGVDLAQRLWHVVVLLLRSAIAAYLGITGLRMFDPALVPPPRFGWGKILFGTFGLFSQVGAYFHLLSDGPIPLLKPNNADEALGMHIASIVLNSVFIYLIFRGVRAGFSRPQTQIALPAERGRGGLSEIIAPGE